jgi:hypothetical protein
MSLMGAHSSATWDHELWDPRYLQRLQRERDGGVFLFYFYQNVNVGGILSLRFGVSALEKAPTTRFLSSFFFLPRKKVDIILLHKLVLRALDIISFFRGVTRSHVNNLLLFNLLISQLNKIYSLIKIHFFYLCISLSQ